jgi:ammonia channel protein AmtB
VHRCVGAGVFDMGCMLLLKLQIDDPLAASPMHGFCGMFGVIFVGLMAKEQYVRQVRDSGLLSSSTLGDESESRALGSRYICFRKKTISHCR